ncbi:MAG: hypothetical protein EDM79_16495, partial [Chloroflexi bacterium]
MSPGYPAADTRKNRLVRVRVTKHLPQGLSVVLDDGQRGIIRTREIAWKDEDAVNWRTDFPVGWEGFAFSI